MGIRARTAIGKVVRAEKTVGAAIIEVQSSAAASRPGSIGASSASDASIWVGIAASEAGGVARYADIAHICVKVDKAAAGTVQVGLDVDLRSTCIAEQISDIEDVEVG